METYTYKFKNKIYITDPSLLLSVAYGTGTPHKNKLSNQQQTMKTVSLSG